MVVEKVRSTIKECKPHQLLMLYDAMMRASNRRFAMGADDDKITRMTERIFRHIDSLPAAERYPFACRLAEEVADCVEIAKTNLECMNEKESAQRSIYSSHLFGLLRVCERYKLPLRLAEDVDRYGRIRDFTGAAHEDRQIYVVLHDVKMKHDKVSIHATWTDRGTANFNVAECEMPREQLCVVSGEGTIVKWTARAFRRHPARHSGQGAIFVLPPLMIRSILAAERRFHDLGVLMHLVRTGAVKNVALPPDIMRVVGMWFQKMLMNTVKHQLIQLGTDYYPTLIDGSVMTINQMHSASAFRKEQRTPVLNKLTR